MADLKLSDKLPALLFNRFPDICSAHVVRGLGPLQGSPHMLVSVQLQSRGLLLACLAAHPAGGPDTCVIGRTNIVKCMFFQYTQSRSKVLSCEVSPGDLCGGALCEEWLPGA